MFFFSCFSGKLAVGTYHQGLCLCFYAVDAESDFEPFDDATNSYGEEDCADAFDDQGFSARYFDQE